MSEQLQNIIKTQVEDKSEKNRLGEELSFLYSVANRLKKDLSFCEKGIHKIKKYGVEIMPDVFEDNFICDTCNRKFGKIHFGHIR